MSMEKNRIRPISSGNGKNVRMSYSRQKEVLEMPDLIEVQKDSYKWFLEEGLKEVFDDISPIADYSGHLSLEFVDFELCEEDVKYSIEKCKERDATYAAPLKVKVRLYNKEKEEITEHQLLKVIRSNITAQRQLEIILVLNQKTEHTCLPTTGDGIYTAIFTPKRHCWK